MKGIAFLSGFTTGLLTLGITLPASCEVISDRTTNSTVNSMGNNFTITNGIPRGGNLFHSFGEFSIPTGGSATFENPSAIENIINRVTGGNISNIDGLIKANGNANLFLINPAGIVFGENARLDIGGSFLGTTAESILFEDGFEFSAVNPQTESLLTINVPLGLQYGTNPSSINVSGANLTVNSGQNLSLLGGDVTISNSDIVAPGGQIQLGGLATADTISLEGLTAKFPENVTRSNITLSNAASINSTSTNGGNITINAADFSMSGGSEILAGLTSGGSDTTSVAGNITINATGNSNISEKSLIANDLQTLSVGNGGNIQLNTGSFSLTGGSRIQTVTNSDGTSGDITVNANGAMEISGFTDDGLFSGILSRSAIENSGSGGNITINNSQNTLTLSNRGFIGAVTNSSSDGGNIETNLNNLVMETGGQIVTATTNLGNAGDITINATESVNISGESRDFVPNPFLDLETFDLNALQFITNSNPNVAESETIPYVSVERTPEQIVSGTTILGTAEDGVDYYSFSVTQGGSRAILDIDNGDTKEAGSVDTKIFLFNQSTGELLEVNDDSEASAGGEGSLGVFRGGTIAADSLIDTTLSEPGFYVLGVGAFPSDAVSNELIEGNSPDVGDTYTLQASIENQGTEGVTIPVDPFNPQNYNPNVEATSGLFSESSGTGSGGNLTINTPQLIINDGGRLSTDNSDVGIGGDINLNINKVFEIGESALVSSITSGSGDAGNITINAEQLSQVNGGTISSSTLSLGNAGSIRITAGESVVLRGESNFGELTTIESSAERNSTGNGGLIEIETPVLRIVNGAQISATTNGNGSGGAIDIQVNLLELNGSSANGIFDSRIVARNSSNNEDASGGTISITAEDVVLTNDATISSSTVREGNAGNLIILTERLLINNGSQIGSGTFKTGDGGNITIEASESVEVLGRNEVNEAASGIFVNPQPDSTGNGGRLTIETGLLRIIDGGFVTASTLGSGDGGDLSISAIDVEVSGVAVDFTGALSGLSVSVDEGGTGNGGNLTLDAERLQVTDGGQVIAGNFGDGNAGDIILRVDDIEVSGISDDGEFVSRIAALSEGDFAAGSIDITANNLSVSDRAQITVSNTGTGDAGNLNVNADTIELNNQGSLQANVAAGNQGNINLDSQFLLLRNGSNITTDATGTANGGNIDINSAIIAGFENSDIIANAVEGNGGNIDITTQGIFGLEFRDELTEESDITASSQFGVNGTVEINNLSIDPSTGLVELTTELTDPSQQIAAGCSTNSNSSFIATGRGGIPQNPKESVDMNSTWSDFRDLSAYRQQRNNNTVENAQISNQPAIVEATGFIRNANGVIEFVALENTPLRNKQVSQCSI